jgi:hypothetical protein
MRMTILLSLILLFSGCNSYDFNISELAHKRVKFEDLPDRVKNFYLYPSEFGESNPSIIDFACLDKDCSYDLVTVDTWYGPWVNYYVLTNQIRRVSFRIDQGTPIPYVVYSDKLYIVDKFNIFTGISDYSALEFTIYDLEE